MIRLIALVAFAWGLISCQPDLFPPGRSADPALPEPSHAPGRPDPTIVIPPPI